MCVIDRRFSHKGHNNLLARAGSSDEVADAIAFLVGNAFVTGIVLDEDGGLHLT